MNKNLTIEPGDDDTRSTIAIWICSTVLSCIIFVVIVGNITVILAITKTTHLLQQRSNMFLINLSITDMSSAILVMSTSLGAITNDMHMMNLSWCNFNCCMNYVLIIVSMLTLSFISIDRYITTKYPLRYRSIMNKTKIIAMILYSWFQGLAFGLAPVIVKWIHYDYWEAVCAIDWQTEIIQARYYVVTACIICFIIPGVLMSINYSLIMWDIKQMPKIPNLQKADSMERNDGNDHRKVMRSLLVIVVLFFICMTPFCAIKFIKVITPSTRVPGYVTLFATYVQYMSSAVNPFVYGIFRRDFRKAYGLIWRRISNSLPMTSRNRSISGVTGSRHSFSKNSLSKLSHGSLRIERNVKIHADVFAFFK